MKNSKFLPIIGLEVHIELKTKSKMFCGCSAKHFQVKPNTHTCPVCLGLPGALPVHNQKAIEWCVMAGLALNCQIPKFSKFDRKNYFYPDLPKGYQISQYDLPFTVNGKLKLKTQTFVPSIRPELMPRGSGRGNSKLKTVRIKRVHLEEDTAKLIHQGGQTLIDFNRSGVPLMEIVSEPDISSPAETRAYLKKLQQIIRSLGISDCDMEKGSMRCEANISLLRKVQSLKFKVQSLPKYKIEIKNLNSFRFVEKALFYEIKRQKEQLLKGKKLSLETRGWDETKQITFPQRVKETAADYRYFPEPDIPPIRWRTNELKDLKTKIPELPDKKIKRYLKDYHLKQSEAEILCQDKFKAEYFEEAIRNKKVKPQQIAKLIVNKRIIIHQVSPAQLIRNLLSQKKAQISNKGQLKDIVQAVIKGNSQAVADYKRGKKETVSFLIGQVMRKTQGKANAQIVRKILIERFKNV